MNRIYFLVVFCLIICMNQKVISQNKLESKIFISSKYKGNIYESEVTGEQYQRMSTWNPLQNEKEPLSPGKAIQLATSEFESIVPKEERSNWILSHVMLKYFETTWPPNYNDTTSQKKWYYIIHFWNNQNKVFAVTNPVLEANNEQFHIIVLMNGECCKPVLRKYSNSVTNSTNPPKQPEKTK